MPQLDSHTEQWFLANVAKDAENSGLTNITYEMKGYLDPCTPKCRPSLRDQAIGDASVTTKYTSIVHENEWTFTPTTHQSRGQSMSAVQQTRVNIYSRSGETATYWRSPKSRKWRHSKVEVVGEA